MGQGIDDPQPRLLLLRVVLHARHPLDRGQRRVIAQGLEVLNEVPERQALAEAVVHDALDGLQEARQGRVLRSDALRLGAVRGVVEEGLEGVFVVPQRRVMVCHAVTRRTCGAPSSWEAATSVGAMQFYVPGAVWPQQ